MKVDLLLAALMLVVEADGTSKNSSAALELAALKTSQDNLKDLITAKLN